MAEQTREERIAGERFERAFKLDSSEIDTEKRMLKISFASEKPVQRWDWEGPYDEVLRVDQNSVDLSRMNDGGALLADHVREKQIGVVEKAWVGDDRRTHAIVRFANDAEGEKEMQRAIDGVRRNVSFAYKIRDSKAAKSEDGKRDVLTATDWEVLEISLVSVPADASVGVGRSEPVKIEQGQVLPAERQVEEKQERVVNKMTEEEKAAAAAAGQTATVTVDREDQILAFGRKYKGVDERWLNAYSLNPTHTVETLRTELQKMFEVKQPTDAAPENNPSEIGLTEKETKRYSISRAIMGQVDPSFAKEAAFEMECHNAIVARGLKTQGGGLFVPTEVQAQKRADLTVGGGLTTGGAVVGTNLMPESFIDLLRNNMATPQLGITIMSGLVGNPSIPRQDSAGTAYWIAEAGEPTESNITFGQLALSPHSLGAVEEFSRQLLIQSTPSVDAIVMNDIAAILARAIDLAIIDGSGSGSEPKGVLSTTGVEEVSQLGAIFSFQDAVAFETAVFEDNAAMGTPKWLARPSVVGALKTLQKTPGSPTSLYLLENGQMNGYNVVRSTQSPAETLIFGDWSQVILAEWGALEIVANDRGSTFRKGNIEVRGIHMVDVQVRYPQALKKLTAFSSESS